MHSGLVLFIDLGLAGAGILRDDAAYRPTSRVIGVEPDRLVGIFQGNIIGNLSVQVLPIEIGDPIILVIFLNVGQQPCGQLIGENVPHRGGVFVVVLGAVAGFDLGESY